MSTAPQTTNQDRDRASVRLLPLSKDPFQAPTDRDMLPSERRLFVQTHRTCVFGYGRQSDGPAMSIVYYVPDENGDLLVATMADRAKAKAVARNGKVSLCVLDETWPFAYLQVYCDAVIDDDEETLIDVMMAVAERMSGEPVPAELRPAVKAVAEQEGRVLVRCRPYATFVTPPRHLHSNDQQEADPLGLGVDALGRSRHTGEVMADVTEKWRSERVTAALYDAASSTPVSQSSAPGRCGVPTWAACSPTSSDLPTFPSAPRYWTYRAGAAWPSAVCVPVRPCITSRPTYLRTCLRGRAGGGPTGSARRDRVRPSRCDRASVP